MTEVLNVRYSASGLFFSVCTECGFAIYDTDPVALRFTQDFGKGIAVAELYMSSNIVALVGGGKKPMYPSNHVIIWDDSQEALVHDIKFETDVLNVLFSEDRLIVVLRNAVYEYKFPFKKINKPSIHRTADNPYGVCSFFSLARREILATIDEKNKNSICVKLPNNSQNEKQTTCSEYYQSDQPIAFLRVSPDGKKLASVLEDGMDISIWDLENLKVKSMSPEFKFRRSGTPALVTNLSFDSKNNFCTSSKSKTIHFFKLDKPYSSILQWTLKSTYTIPNDDQNIHESNRLCVGTCDKAIVVAFQNESCSYYTFHFVVADYLPVSSLFLYQDGIYNELDY
jgi:WD40 repeat protein